MSAVASRNPFDLLSDEKPAQASATPKAEQAKTDAPAARGGQRGRTGPASRGGRYYQRGGAAASGPRDQPDTDEAAPREGKRFHDDRGRGRGRGGRGRGDRGRDGKRSVTGRTDTEKTVAQGWGADEGNKELKAEEEGSKDAAAEAPNNDWATDGATPAATNDAWGVPAEASGEAAKDGAPTESRRPPREEEEVDNTLTLDEYLAQKEKLSVPELELRKANDGDEDPFKNAQQVVKGDENDYFASAAKTKAAKQRAAKDEKKKTFIEIDGTFADQQRGGSRGGRGGRGGDRGASRGARGEGRGRGGGRGRGRGSFPGANGNRQVVPNDESAFPPLS